MLVSGLQIIMESIYPAAAAVFGLVVIVLLFVVVRRQPTRAVDAELSLLREESYEFQRRLAVEEQKSSRLSELDQAVAELRDTRDAAEKARTGLAATLAAKVEDIGKLNERLTGEMKAREAASAEAGQLRARVATLEEALEQERGQAKKNLELLTDARERMTQEFKVLAAEVMRSHGETFSKQNKDQLDVILAPLREKLGEFQTGLLSAHTESLKERATLAEQIRTLSDQSSRMTSETSNLTRALKGEAQTQGAWGEMILSSILERSGLREGEEYFTQQSHTTEEGRRLRTDVVVHLPGGQKIIIDSKLSLVAFDEFVNAGNPVDRAAALKRHLASVRTHIRTLAGKEYHAAAGSSLDYVVMFIPIEGALAAALQEDPNLTADAVGANVAIATPTTLMIALRTVDNVWKVERRNKNAEQIAERAGKIYDKLVNFVDDMNDLGQRLTQARASYDDAMAKLTSGRGNLAGQVEQLKELGAKSNKALQLSLIEPDEPEEIRTAAG